MIELYLNDTTLLLRLQVEKRERPCFGSRSKEWERVSAGSCDAGSCVASSPSRAVEATAAELRSELKNGLSHESFVRFRKNPNSANLHRLFSIF